MDNTVLTDTCFVPLSGSLAAGLMNGIGCVRI
jgi:hypothetical protein